MKLTYYIKRLSQADNLLLQEALCKFRPADSTSPDVFNILRDPYSLVLVALYDKNIVGWAVAYELQRFSKRALFLYEIDVVEAMRKQGIATKLIQELKNFARNNDIAFMFVLTNSSNRAAMKLYEATGATRVNNDDVMFKYTNF